MVSSPTQEPHRGYRCSSMILQGQGKAGECCFHLTALLVVISSLSWYWSDHLKKRHSNNDSNTPGKSISQGVELILGLFTYWTTFPHLDKCSKCRAEGFEGQAGFSEHQMQGHKWHQGLISHGILSICITSLTSLRLIVWVPLHTCQKPRSGRGTHKGQELNHIIVSDCQVCMDHIRTLTVPFHAMWWIV